MDQLPTLSSTFLALVVLANASEGHQEISAKAGSDVSLDCLGNTPAPIEAIKWIKTTHSDQYVYFYRDDVFYKDYQHESFQGRVQLRDENMRDGDVSVILKKITTSDAGQYECHVSLKNKTLKRAYSDLWCVVKLSIVVPQQIITNPGDNITLPCQASRNVSILAVEWTRADLHDPVYFHRNDRGLEPRDQEPPFVNRVKLMDRQMKDGDASLVVMNVQVGDAGTYECRQKLRVEKQVKRTVVKSEAIGIIDLMVRGHTAGNIWDRGGNVCVGLAFCQLVCFLMVL